MVNKTRTYFEKIVTQGNGCYEHQWFDACSVMIRRFVETLIIEPYEAKKKAADIKDGNGDFLMLSKLIDRTLADASWNLSRESKRTLPLIKSLGDRSRTIGDTWRQREMSTTLSPVFECWRTTCSILLG